MKTDEALELIRIAESGYRVQFEVLEGCLLASDHFPEKDEPLIKDLETAWDLAERFSRAVNLDRYFNIYVVDQDFSPVSGYFDRMINKR